MVTSVSASDGKNSMSIFHKEMQKYTRVVQNFELKNLLPYIHEYEFN